MYEVYCPAPGDRVRFHFDANNYIDVVLRQTIEQAVAHSRDAVSISIEARNAARGPQSMHIEVEQMPWGKPIMEVRMSAELDGSRENMPTVNDPKWRGYDCSASRKDRDGTLPESR
jgi:hypothetical protein